MAQNVKELLRSLRDLTNLTGNLHQYQVMHMEAWGHLVLDDICPEWQLHYDSSSQTSSSDKGATSYRYLEEVFSFTFKKEVPTPTEKNLKDFKLLQEWIRVLMVNGHCVVRIYDPSGQIF